MPKSSDGRRCSLPIVRQSFGRQGALVTAATCVVLHWRAESAPVPLNDMPCDTLACPAGHQHRWNAPDLLCAQGICNVVNDTDTCCVQGWFSSFSWRVVAASAVVEEWEVSKIRFLQADSCDPESVVATIPGIHWGYVGWPNGAAFSHHYGNGNTAARAFAGDPASTPRSPAPERQIWVSVGPCISEACFLGYRWEADTTRYPAGTCRQGQGACASSGLVRKVPSLRIGCAEVHQSSSLGRFAQELRLQLLDVSTNGTDGRGLWRTAGILRGLSGGLARLQMEAVALHDNATAEGVA